MPQGPHPIEVCVRMYNVGFGDSFLVSFEYGTDIGQGRTDRHILIDLGTKARSMHDGKPGPDVLAIAKLIEQHCRGKLDVLVMSHRHEDHVSGFGRKSVAEIIDRIAPDLVIRPWTEDPDLHADDRAPAAGIALDNDGDRPLGGRDLKHLSAIRRMEEAMGTLAAVESTLPSLTSPAVREALMAAADEKYKNKEAVGNLKRWSEGGKGVYVYSKQPSKIEQHIPGISVTVLGPPLPSQHPDIEHQDDDRAGYWLRVADGIAVGNAEPVLSQGEAALPDNVQLAGPQRWIVDHLTESEWVSPLELVTRYDKYMNNTSVVLLIEAGLKPHRMLFPGDAQGESSDYWIKNFRSKLGKLDLYKVGHHGSRNATAEELVKMWNEPLNRGNKLAGMMSTMPGVYPTKGGGPPGTEVPRDNLVDALKARMKPFLRSDDLPKGKDFYEVRCDLTSNAGKFEQR